MSATNEWCQIQEDGRGESEPGKNPWVGGGPNPDPFDTLKLFQMRDVTLFLILAPFCSSAVPTSLG
jgi:hypothetical protein